MGLFASDRTVKIYFDVQGDVVEEPTDDWVEVLAELPYSLHEQYMKRMKAQMTQDGSYIIELGNLMFEPEFFAKIIKGWSAEVPVTVENIKKMHGKILDNLSMKLRELYGLTKAEK